MSIDQNNREEENFLFGKNKELPFVVPKGYFYSLTAIIINKIEALEELGEFETLKSLDKKNVFTIPENYFGSAEDTVADENELAAFSVLNSIAKPVLKPLSAQFTEELNASVIRKAEIADEIKEYKTLYAIDKQNSFAVAPGYFDSVADEVKERIYSGNEGKFSIFTIILQTILKPRVAIAYSFAILIIAGSVWYYNRETTYTMIQGGSGDCKTLACLEKNELLNEKNIRDFDEDNLYEMVDVEQLDKQISEKETSDSVNLNKNSLPDSTHK
jgi:hypothetical protein